MSDFCKTFQAERGQIVAIRQHSEDHPDPWQLLILCQPAGAISHCQVALGFSSEEKRDRMFDQLTIKTLLNLTASLYACFPGGSFSQEAYEQAFPPLESPAP